MRKMVCGLAVLSILFAAGIYNSLIFREKTQLLESYIRAASALVYEGEPAQGIILLESAIDEWSGMGKYNHIFIHSDGANSLTDAFYDYLSVLKNSGKDDSALRDKLLYHIQSLARNEMLSLEAVL